VCPDRQDCLSSIAGFADDTLSLLTALPHASVVVCTHNRSTYLRQSCDAILAVDYPSDRFDLLIVNNASTDETPRIAAQLAQQHPNVHVVHELRLGLSRARNAGVQHARGELILFADDDAFPEAGWLRALAHALSEDGVLAAGGPVQPIFAGELPAWFSDRFLPYLSVWDKGSQAQRLTYNDYPRGNNIGFRREVFQRFGTFSTQLGRKGKSLLSCEETELCLRVERGGGTILYVPEARIAHVTPVDRLTPDWLARRFAAQGRSEAIVEWRHAGWDGLRRGLAHWGKLVEYAALDDSSEPSAEIYKRCTEEAFRAYSRARWTVPLTVPRYRAPRGTSKWLPWT